MKVMAFSGKTFYENLNLVLEKYLSKTLTAGQTKLKVSKFEAFWSPILAVNEWFLKR